MAGIIGGSAFGRGDSIIDVNGAVLLAGVHVAVVGAGRSTGFETAIALELTGRVNHSTDQHQALCLLNVDGAARIISELMGLAQRADPGFLELLLARINDLPKEQQR